MQHLKNSSKCVNVGTKMLIKEVYTGGRSRDYYRTLETLFDAASNSAQGVSKFLITWNSQHRLEILEKKHVLVLNHGHEYLSRKVMMNEVENQLQDSYARDILPDTNTYDVVNIEFARKFA